MNQHLTNLQLAYLAGFLDCDGSILAQTMQKSDYVFKHQIRLSVVFYQKTARKYSLLKIQEELGMGTMTDKPNGMSELTIIGQQNVEILLRQIKPFLRMKQKQANLVLLIIEQLHSTKKSFTKSQMPHEQSLLKFLQICHLVDQVCDLNFSKSQTITVDFVTQRFQDLKWIQK
jgi:hypothetical protein